MGLPLRKKTSFILGSFLLALALIILFMLRFSETRDDIKYTNSDKIVSTNDPLITQQLTERDFLPDDLPLITIVDPSRGPEDAVVTIVEFSDFECPFCRDAQVVIEKVLARYPESVRHVWKDAPSTSLHKNAFGAHLAARCAQEQNAFWEFHDALFANQLRLNESTYVSIADNLSINTRLWKQCFDAEAGRAKVERSIVEAEVLGVDITPFFFINNTRLSGKITFERIDQIIRQALQ